METLALNESKLAQWACPLESCWKLKQPQSWQKQSYWILSIFCFPEIWSPLVNRRLFFGIFQWFIKCSGHIGKLRFYGFIFLKLYLVLLIFKAWFYFAILENLDININVFRHKLMYQLLWSYLMWSEVFHWF